jgi:hypothetical protein
VLGYHGSDLALDADQHLPSAFSRELADQRAKRVAGIGRAAAPTAWRGPAFDVLVSP